LNFLIPMDWVDSIPPLYDRGYTVWVNFMGADVDECCLDNNSATVPAPSVIGRSLDVVLLRANVWGNRIRDEQRFEGFHWVLRYYPTSDIDVWTHPRDPIWAPFNFAKPRGWRRFLRKLSRINFWTDDPVDHLRYHAFVPPDINTGGILGLSYMSDDESAAVWLAGGGATTAHELGHNHGLKHAPGGCEEPNTNSRYPQYYAPDGTPYPRASIGQWGIDLYTSTFTLHNPVSTHDLMSYCRPRFMSVYTYQELHSRIHRVGMSVPGRSTGLARLATQAEGEYLVGSGFISEEGIELDPPGFYRVPLPDDEEPSPDKGRYTVQLRDAQGNVLYTQAFDPLPTGEDPEPEEGSFFLIVPWVKGTAEIALLFQDRLLGTVPVSAHAPMVTLLEPNGGETWPAEGPVTIRWEATDADGDSLLAVVQYSADGGDTWKAVATDVEETSIELDAANLPGTSQAVVRVCVSDGVNTTCDQSDGPFSVPAKDPEVFIISPTDGMVFPTGEQVIMGSVATDLEDGPIKNESAYVWTSDRDGQLGTGRSLWGLPLSAGRHTLTLTVTDSDGNATSASVTITVAPEEVELPPEKPRPLAVGISPMILIASGACILVLAMLLGLITLGYILGRRGSGRGTPRGSY
jgi:hypothetical protein